jgi:hypothetical protein
VESHVTDLAVARQTLGATLGPTGKTDPVAGGIVGKHAFVSWVDDLIWHATPTDKARIEFTSKELGGDILGFEVIATMAEAPGPHLKKWLETKRMLPQDVDFESARTAWKDLYGGGSLAAIGRCVDDTKARRSAPWRLTGKYTEAVAEDTRLKGTRSILEAPVGLSKRRRFQQPAVESGGAGGGARGQQGQGPLLHPNLDTNLAHQGQGGRHRPFVT